MVLSTEFITSIDETLVQDAGMEVLFDGEVRLYLGMAPREAQLPYLVHRLKGRLGDDGVTQTGEWLIDVWDDSPNSARAWGIAKLVKVLMHNHSDPELNGASLFFEDWEQIATDDPEIWRIELIFEATWPDLELAQSTG